MVQRRFPFRCRCIVSRAMVQIMCDSRQTAVLIARRVSSLAEL